MQLIRAASARAAALSAALTLVCGCGSKTGVLEPDPGLEIPDECEVLCPESSFCRPLCQLEIGCVPMEPPDCDDDDPCTEDSCDDAAGRCVHSPITADRDGDGHTVPLECGGDDCDDDDPTIYPGAPEQCNGVDDDCDGLVDEGASLEPWGIEVVVSSSPLTDDASDVAWTGEHWVVGFWDYRGGDADVFLLRLDRFGSRVDDEEVQVTTSAGDGFGPSLAWTGRELGAVWSDRRDGNFEIYFARFDGELRRLTADIRLSEDPGWSVYPTIAWSGRDYLVVWQDDRSGAFEVLARRVGADGPEAGTTVVSDGGAAETESPTVVVEGGAYHFAWLEGDVGRYDVVHARTDLALEDLEVQVLSSDLPGSAADPALATGDGVVALSWEQESAGGFETHLAVIEGSGDLVVPPAPLPTDGMVAREASLLWVNSGFLAVWSGLAGESFDLLFTVVEPDGAPTVVASPLSSAPGDAIGASLALGPGEVGVLWSDARSGSYDVYFTRLLCAGL